MSAAEIYGRWLPVQRVFWLARACSIAPIDAVRAYRQAQAQAHRPPFRGPADYSGTIRTTSCYRCNGVGHHDHAARAGVDCAYCNGVGMVEIPWPPIDWARVAPAAPSGRVQCEPCSGWGVLTDKSKCTTCGGEGMVDRRAH